MSESYSQIADEQLDKIERDDPDLYEEALKACELIFDRPSSAQALSSAITTGTGGVVFRLPVIGHPPWYVFWTSDGPSVEAVLRHPQ